MKIPWREFFPPVEWLVSYRAVWLGSDAVAGVTLAAYAVPVSMAYASLAGVAPESGIYCFLIGGLFYALFGTCRQLAIGPTSAISLVVGSTVAGMAAGDAARWAAIAALTALTVGLFSLGAWILRLSGLVSFIGETILIGFKAGAALTIAMTQLPKLFGVKGGGDNFFERAWTLAGELGQMNWAVFGIGLAALVLLLAGEKLLPHRPIALLVIAVATTVMSFTALATAGVTTVGALPAGLPPFAIPSLRWSDVDGILPLAGACFLLSYIESISAARTLADLNDYEVNPRQELLALAAANAAVAFGHGFPVAGGLSQSAVNDKAGARTPLSLVFTSLTLAICLLFLTGLLRNMPTVVLASIVLVSVRGLIDIKGLRHLWQISRSEFAVSMVALVGVLLLGILKGVLVAAVASLLLLIASSARPHVAFLGRIPGTRRYSDLERHPDNEIVPGVVIFRVEGALVYFNVEHVRHVVWKRIEATPDLRLVVGDLSDSPTVDVAGARMLSHLCRDLTKRGVHLRVVEAHARNRDLLRAAGLEQQIGHVGRRMTVDQAVTEIQGNAVTQALAQ